MRKGWLDNTYDNLQNKNCITCGKFVTSKGYVIDGTGTSIQHAECFIKNIKNKI